MKTNYAPEHALTSFSTALTRPYASTQISRTPIDCVVAEIIAADDHAENEPTYKLLQWVAEVIVNDELTTEIARGCVVKKRLEILIAATTPSAA